MRNIEVVDYDMKWKNKFKEEKDNIMDILGDEVVNIFHIGSTSVKGLKAKPIIDILLVVRDLDRLDSFNGDFEKLGYEARGEYGIARRRFYMKGGDNRTHHIHAFKYDNISEIERHLLFRDYLRENKDARVEYGELKSQLALKYPHDIDGYCGGKNYLVKKIEEDAIIWHFTKRV